MSKSKKPDLPEYIVKLYDSVIDLYGAGFVINRQSVSNAMKEMNRKKDKTKWKIMEESIDTNYSSPSYRYLYLHKYAMCHTGMTRALLKRALKSNLSLSSRIFSRRFINICSLGGGPGCDIVAILKTFSDLFYFKCSVTVIDNEIKWKKVFAYILEELREGKLGKVKKLVSAKRFTYEYVKANLLRDLESDPDVRQRIENADFLSMVNFISASACCRTIDMLHEIFHSMKPGALLMYIDDAKCNYLEEVEEVARHYRLKTMYGPIKRFKYRIPVFKKKRFGYESNCEAKISFQIWMKLSKEKRSRRNQRMRFTNRNYYDGSHDRPHVMNESHSPLNVPESAESSLVDSEPVTTQSSEPNENVISTILETGSPPPPLNIDVLYTLLGMNNIPKSDRTSSSMNFQELTKFESSSDILTCTDISESINSSTSVNYQETLTEFSNSSCIFNCGLASTNISESTTNSTESVDFQESSVIQTMSTDVSELAVPDLFNDVRELNKHLTVSTIPEPEQPLLTTPVMLETNNIPELYSAVLPTSLPQFCDSELGETLESPNVHRRDNFLTSSNDSESHTPFATSSSQISAVISKFNSSLSLSNNVGINEYPTPIMELGKQQTLSNAVEESNCKIKAVIQAAELCSSVQPISLPHFCTLERVEILTTSNVQQQNSLLTPVLDSESDSSFTSLACPEPDRALICSEGATRLLNPLSLCSVRRTEKGIAEAIDQEESTSLSLSTLLTVRPRIPVSIQELEELQTSSNVFEKSNNEPEIDEIEGSFCTTS